MVMGLFRKKYRADKVKKPQSFQNINKPESKTYLSNKQPNSRNYNDSQKYDMPYSPFLPKPPKKEGFFISRDDKFKVRFFVKKLQSNLYNNTVLPTKLTQHFEQLYKMVYYFSRNCNIPTWAEYYDLLFISEAHAVIISKYTFDVGPLLTINEIMNANMSLSYLKEIFIKLEIIINYMIKLYNEGKNYNYLLKDSVKELKLLGLVSSLLYNKLLLIADVRIKLNKASHIRQIKILDANNDVYRLIDIETEFKFLLSEIYVELVSIYVKIQEPYLEKFYCLWEDKALDTNKFNTFYYI